MNLSILSKFENSEKTLMSHSMGHEECSILKFTGKCRKNSFLGEYATNLSIFRHFGSLFALTMVPMMEFLSVLDWDQMSD